MNDIGRIIYNIKNGSSPAHSYIVEGRESGRRDFIARLVSGLGCHPLDVVHMTKSGKTSYKVEDAGEFMERLSMGAYGEILAGIIDDADCLGEIVQNKLLKTLEEPQNSTVILLGSSGRDRLLETVRSRCGLLRICDYGYDATGREEDALLQDTASLILDRGASFYEIRDAIDKSVNTKEDALALLDLLEDELRKGITGGIPELIFAEGLEASEKTRADIERGMDKSKALKRLRLELSEL